MEWALGHSPRPPAGGGGGRSTLYIQDYNRQKQITLSGGVEGGGRGGGGKGGGEMGGIGSNRCESGMCDLSNGVIHIKSQLFVRAEEK